MKYLLINSVAGVGSTGKIAADICRKLMLEGHEVVLAYGRDKANCDDIRTIKIGNKFDVYWHVGMTRLFDKHGLCSKHATKQFLKWVENYEPEVIWLHNIHGYYINYEELFEYIKRHNKKVKWTLHDCWAFTGHCSYFTYAKCEQWKTNCLCCPQIHSYPSCLFKVKVDKIFEIKRAAFTGVDGMELIVPSQWLNNLVSQSFLKEYQCTVIYNEINRNIFKPTVSSFRRDFHLEDKRIVLGVASTWSKRKGLDDFCKLATMLSDSYAIVLVGLSEKQIRKLPKKIIGLKRTGKIEEFAQNYASATVYVNPSKEETSCIANREAMDCGTSATVYSESLCEEVISTFGNGVAVNQNVYALYKAITGKTFNEKKQTGVGCLIAMTRAENQTQLAQLYTVADFFVNPTYEDNYPTVNLEAIACGTYVVTYDSGGCRETLRN